MTVALDPVTLEVIRNALPAVANEMAVDLQRTSYNMMIYEVRDFCTALVNTAGELICQNVGGVSHFVADLGVVITDGMRRYGRQGFAPGDVVITNHQAVAGQHLNNIVIYAPYFHDGELLMFAMVRAHWIDVGGMSTGFGAGPTVADPWVEGLQLDQLKIYEAGKLNETLYRVLKDNIRFPESSLGDMKSQMAACRLAARRMNELFGKYGRDTMLEAIARIFDETEAKCRNVVSQLADGVYEAAAALDEDGVTRGEPVPIRAKVTIENGAMTIDLSGCSQERRAAINSRTFAGARVAYKALTGPLDPVNEGSFRALKVIIPEGNVMMARFPAPMSSWSVIVPMVVDTIVAALAPAMRERVPAGHHGVGVPGRRAQRFDRRHRAQMPGPGRGPRVAHGFRRRRKISRRAGDRHARAQPGRGEMEFRARAQEPMPALGPVGRGAGRIRRLSRARTGRARLSRRGRGASVGAGAHRGDRAHRRRRRLGRSPRTRSHGGARGRARGVHLRALGARALRGRARGRPDGRPCRNRTRAECDTIRPRKREARGEGMSLSNVIAGLDTASRVYPTCGGQDCGTRANPSSDAIHPPCEHDGCAGHKRVYARLRRAFARA